MLGRDLKSKRKSSGMAQFALSSRWGIHITTLRRWEKSNKKLPGLISDAAEGAFAKQWKVPNKEEDANYEERMLRKAKEQQAKTVEERVPSLRETGLRFGEE